MYERILVPLDGSKRAERILPFVEKLALGFGSEVLFLQVIDISLLYVGPFTYYSEFELGVNEIRRLNQEAEIYLETLDGEFKAKGIHARYLVTEGSIVNTIINVAEKEDVKLIAMASHGRTGLARVFYGSVAAGVLHLIDRPLLIIRSEGDE